MADRKDLKLFTALISFGDVHIVRTKGCNYFSLSYGGSKRDEGCEITEPHSPLE
jgi:hypothetical protein